MFYVTENMGGYDYHSYADCFVGVLFDIVDNEGLQFYILFHQVALSKCPNTA